jgi:site-specific DNA-cytosine methylase/phage anti-repressor protein
MTELNIVELIEKNPITKLTNTYQSKLIEKIKDKFNDDEKHLFVANFYCFLNYKDNDFVVDLDNVWEWLGFKQKYNAKRLLEKDFKLDIDYKILLRRKEEEEKNEEKKRGGSNYQQIMLTVETFKLYCIKAGTEKAGQIHNYYVKLEKLLHEITEEQFEEIKIQFEEQKKQLENKDKILEEIIENQTLKSRMEREKLLLEKFALCGPIIYIILVKTLENGNFIVKIGESGKGIKLRYKDHKSDYSECVLLDCFQAVKHKEFEKFIHNKIKDNNYKKLPNHEHENELFLIDDKLPYKTLLQFINENLKIYNELTIKDFNILHEKNEKLEEINKRLEMEIELLKFKLIHIPNEDLNVNNILKNNEKNKELEEIIKQLENKLTETKNELIETKNELTTTKNKLTSTKNELITTKKEITKTNDPSNNKLNIKTISTTQFSIGTGNTNLLNTLDLFSGCGGMTHGFKNAGYNVVAGVDIDNKYINNYNKNFGNTGICIDFTELSPDKFNEIYNRENIKIDIITVNLNKNTCVFFDNFINYIDFYKPKAFFIDYELLRPNQQNGLNIKKINNYNCIYDSNINISNFEIPQLKRRTIIIGIRKDLKVIPTLPDTTCNTIIPLKNILLPKEDVDKSSFLSENTIIEIKNKLEIYKQNESGFGSKFVDFNKPCFSLYSHFHKDKRIALVKHSETEIRYLTMLELKRLQSFPDDFIIEGSSIKDVIIQIFTSTSCRFAYHIAIHIQNLLKNSVS